MPRPSALPLSLVLSLAGAYVIAQEAPAPPTFNWTSVKACSELKWKPCYLPNFECARLNVPLDYSAPDKGPVAIAMTRFRSTADASAYRGPILLNPGGPGGSGVEWVLQVGPQIAKVAGPEFDIVGFDPRGVSLSEPTVSWFDNDAERVAWIPPATNAVYHSVNASADALARFAARTQIQAQLAVARDTKNTLQHVTTDNTARDMLTITEKFGFEKLQFYGISYGTVLGATFASMFPDKVGRIAIDGVVPMDEYYSGKFFFLAALQLLIFLGLPAQMTNAVLDADKALDAFASSCFEAGPEACAFHNNASSASAISDAITALFTSVQTNPVAAFAAPAAGAYGIVDYSFLKNVFFQILYRPYDLFPVLAAGLANLAAGNASTIYAGAMQGVQPFTCSADAAPQPHSFESFVSIICNDAAALNDTLPELEENYKAGERSSRNFGDLIANWRMLCAPWKVHREGRFSGPFGAEKTATPLLVIGNTADHVTPLAGAAKTVSFFPGSALLTYDAVGHTSTIAPSNCVYGVLGAYFRDGTLPPKDTVCQPDVKLFGPPPTEPAPPAASGEARREVTRRGLGAGITGMWGTRFTL
ncbi:hypothetical protein MIND_01166400 [Mycena indigotica]|uniref:Uncharacterized protein n=1 Tax=Mycena indigotica TaxID=2126181 RepID=A0A8H6VST2_9AGAR|nr:uncharacterized protein MIND_01166400 [Mycena indigotica]KAF7292682.1 hypothetical protein MIND_01166400 [Mycena indigotica]